MLSLLNAKTARNEIERECIYALVGYAQSWINAGYKLEKWPFGKPLSEDVQADLLLVTGSGGQPQFLPVHRRYSLTPEEAAELDVQQTAKERDANIKRDGRARASRIFAGFITSPYYAQLRRCARCQKFFVNMRGYRN